jgi:hypothetical protein
MHASSERIHIRHAAPHPRAARLRELHGHDELAVGGVDTHAAVQLLDRLLDVGGEGAGSAAALSASDRDAALAALHRARWGDRIVASLACAACGAMNDLSFALSALQRQLWQASERTRVSAPRALDDAQGGHWRLPGAEDEDAAAQLGVAAGRAQLVALVCSDMQPDAQAALLADPQSAGERLEALAPLLDVDLEARCIECDHTQLARFDIQSFVLQRLLDEREAVLGEVHALASAYGWSLSEILSLPCSLRRSLVQRLTATGPVFG